MSETPVESWREEVLVWSYSLRRRWWRSGRGWIRREEASGRCLRGRHDDSELATYPERRAWAMLAPSVLAVS